MLAVETPINIFSASKAVAAMVGLLKPGGSLVMTFPYCDHQYIHSNYDMPGKGYGRGSGVLCQSFSKAILRSWCTTFGLVIEEQEYWRMFDGKYWSKGNRLPVYEKATADTSHQLSCVWMIVGGR